MPQKLLSTCLIVLVQLLSLQVFAGRCTGSAPCHACTTCSSCKYCSTNGGTCGVCSNGNGSSSGSNTSEFPTKTVLFGSAAVGIAYLVGRSTKKK